MASCWTWTEFSQKGLELESAIQFYSSMDWSPAQRIGSSWDHKNRLVMLTKLKKISLLTFSHSSLFIGRWGIWCVDCKWQRKYVLKSSHGSLNNQPWILESHVRSKIILEKKNIFYFSCRFHEMGFYDIPAMTSFILKETGQPQLSYVGHSMGTTMFFAFCSTRPELQSRIRQMHALAPVAFMSRLKSPIRKVAPFVRLLQVRWSIFFGKIWLQIYFCRCPWQIWSNTNVSRTEIHWDIWRWKSSGWLTSEPKVTRPLLAHLSAQIRSRSIRWVDFH